MAKYGTPEYTDEVLEKFAKRYNFDIKEGLGLVDFKQIAEDYIEDSKKRIEQCGGIEDFVAGGEYYSLDNYTHELHEVVYFYVQKLLFEKLR